MTEPLQVTRILDKKIWIESDFFGDKHVMIKHDHEDFEPFCYCSFYYNYAYTSNSSIRRQAEEIAKLLGATEPIEHRSRPLSIKPSSQ